MQKEKPKIVCLSNGPYYLINDFTPKVVSNLESSTGEPLSTVSGVALCRCGGSANKPFCDGTHGTNGFTDKNLADSKLNKRDDYKSKNITIHDNRAVCAHAGLCTERLSSVFKLKQEPWIDPNAEDAEKIIEIVRSCPSGSLSYSVNDIESKDIERVPKVTVAKNGPFIVTGDIELLGQSMGDQVSKEHYTLCRCGASKNKPFCDGTHWSIGFTDDSSYNDLN